MGQQLNLGNLILVSKEKTSRMMIVDIEVEVVVDIVVEVVVEVAVETELLAIPMYT